MASLKMKPAVMVLLVAVGIMLTVSHVAATSGSSGGDDKNSWSGGSTKSPSGSSPGSGGSSGSPWGSSPGGSSPGGSSPGGSSGSPWGSSPGGSSPGGSGDSPSGSSPGGSSPGHGGSSPGGSSPGGSSPGGSSPGGSSPGGSSPGGSSPGYGGSSPPSGGGDHEGGSSPGNGGSSPPSGGGDHEGGSSPGHGGSSPPSGGGDHEGGSSPGHGGGKPDCKKKGGMCGDPKIVGGDGVVFYFHGRKDENFCLVSDSDLHINAHFIGKRPEGRHRDFTWVQALGFVFGEHSLTIAAKPVAVWDGKVDQLQLAYNGVPFALGASAWASPDGAMTLNRIGAANAVDLVIEEKMGVALTVVPITKEENRVHKYGIGAGDCFAHLDMQFRFYNLSSAVNGVLGQTYQPGFVSPVTKGVAMPIMGGADRFSSSSLLATDCRVSQYTAQAIPQGSAMPSFIAMCGSSGLPAGVPGGLTCRR